MAGRMPDVLPGGDGAAAGPARVRMPGVDVSSGAEQLASVIGRIADAELAKAQQAQRDRDELTLANASSRLRAEQTKKLQEETDALKDEDLDGFSDRFGAGFAQATDAAAEQLPGRLQKRFRTDAAQTGLGLNLRSDEVVRARTTDRQAKVLDESQEAADQTVYTDPTQYAATLQASTAAINSSGLPEAIKAARLAKLPNRLASNRMLGLINSAPEAAMAELDKGEWKDALSPEQVEHFRDQAKRQRKIMDDEAHAALDPIADEIINRITGKPALFASEVSAFAQRPELARFSAEARGQEVRLFAGRAAETRLIAIGNDNPWAAKSELLSGQHDGYLEPSDKQRLLTGLSNEIDRRNREAEARRREAEGIQNAIRSVSLQREMEDDLASRSTTGKPGAVNMQEVARVFGERRVTEFAQAQKDADKLFGVVGDFGSMSPAAINERLGKLRPAPGAKDFAANSKLLETALRVRDEEFKRRAEDPAGAAMRNGEVSARWAAWASNPADAKARAAYVAATTHQQGLLGVPGGRQRLLPAEVAGGIADRLTGASAAERPGEMRRIVSELSAMWGDDAGAAIAQVAEASKSDELKALAPLAQRPGALAKIAGALAEKDPGDAVNAQARKTIKSRVQSQLAPLQRSLRNSPGGGEVIRSISEAAERAAVIDAAGGRNADAAAREAAAAYLDQFQFSGDVRAPKTWRGRPLNLRAAQSGAHAVLWDLWNGDKLSLPVGDPRLKGEAAKEAQRQYVASALRWISAVDDSGLVLTDERGVAVADKSGKPVRASWDELLKANAATPITPPVLMQDGGF